MTKKFKPGDVVVWEQIDSTDKYYFLIISSYTNFYCIKNLKSGDIDDMTVDTFESSLGCFKESRLITDEERLELL